MQVTPPTHGISALSTTYGPGELGAIGAIAGAYAENVPVFHLTAMPTRAAQHKRQVIHHTLGNGEFDFLFTTRVTTCGELDQALRQAAHNGSASYIEVVTDEFAAPPLPQKLHESRDTLYAR
jgi:TPP-dependent 2-oxoacid decarboxylase